MNSGLPPSGGRIQALLALLLTFVAPPAALLSFAHSFNMPPWVTVMLVLIYWILAIFFSFLTEVWQKLKAPWIEVIASRVDQYIRSILSGYNYHYGLSFNFEYRDLDVKGITTLGMYTLDLEKVFVELRIDPKVPHIASPNILYESANRSHVTTELLNGSHTIWDYLVSPHFRDQQLVILGPPGSGKTTLLKHLGLTLVHRKLPLAAKPFQYKLPVLLALREHSKAIKANNTLADAIRENVKRWDYPMPTGWIERRLERGKCLVLLDGLDEVADATERQQTVDWVDRQMRNYGTNRFILTSRPFGYQKNPLAGVTTLEVQPLTFPQVTQFIKNWYRAIEIKSAVRDDRGVRRKAEQGARELLQRLRETPALFELAVNPLLLTMIATVHRYRGTLPGARFELYKEICEVFLGKRREARGIAQDLRAGQRQLVLEPLAYEMMLQGVRTIDEKQIEHWISGPLRQVSTALTPHGFLESVQNTSGLLLERELGIYSFAHKTFQEYLAAVHIGKQGLSPILTSHVQDEWWQETIRLYCAQADATPLIKTCLNASTVATLVLALECAREAQSIQPDVEEQMKIVIEQSIESSDSERRRIVAEALLSQRLSQMYALNEHTFIDTALITHAEYQLFLDNQRSQNKYLQPDHWTQYTFPSGQGQQPVLGIRHSDAEAFCAWLSKHRGGVWRYRLPNKEDFTLASQDMWKHIAQDTGYWTQTEQRFVWSHEEPPHSLSTHIQASLTTISNHDLSYILFRALDLDLYDKYRIISDFPSHIGNALINLTALGTSLITNVSLANNEATKGIDTITDNAIKIAEINPGLGRGLGRGLVRIFDLALHRAHHLTPFDIDRSFDRNLEHERDRAIAHLLDSDLVRSGSNLYRDVFLLQERRAQRFPAWEGILLVKEQILDTMKSSEQ